MGTQEKRYPVNKGQRLRLECQRLHEKGKGVFVYGGLIIFVPDTIPGKTYEIAITGTCKTFAFGEVVQ